MRVSLDSSVLVAAAFEENPDYAASSALLGVRGWQVHACAHALAEVFSTLTGGRSVPRTRPADAARYLDESVIPFAEIVPLDGSDILQAARECTARGVRGGAIYDYLHLVAARKAKAERLYTLNLRHFRAFHRMGDPEIAVP